MREPSVLLHPLMYWLTLFFRYTHFAFDQSKPAIAHICSLVYTVSVLSLCSFPANDPLEFVGDAIHNLVVRIVVIRFVSRRLAHRYHTPLMRHAVIEYLVNLFTQNETMGRIYASAGIDWGSITISDEKKAAVIRWQKDTSQPVPKVLSDLLEAHAWGILHAAGWTALEDHYTANLLPAIEEAIHFFEKDVYAHQPPLFGSMVGRANQRWDPFHNKDVDSEHTAKFFKALDLTSPSDIHAWIQPAVLFLSVTTFPNIKHGNLECSDMQAAFLGFDYISYVFRLNMDSRWPHHRESVKGGAAFGTHLKRMVLCDASIVYVLARSGIRMPAPPADIVGKARDRVIAQFFAAAVAKVYENNPDSGFSMLCDLLGPLLGKAKHVAETFGILPKMSEGSFTLVPQHTPPEPVFGPLWFYNAASAPALPMDTLEHAPPSTHDTSTAALSSSSSRQASGAPEGSRHATSDAPSLLRHEDDDTEGVVQAPWPPDPSYFLPSHPAGPTPNARNKCPPALSQPSVAVAAAPPPYTSSSRSRQEPLARPGEVPQYARAPSPLGTTDNDNRRTSLLLPPRPATAMAVVNHPSRRPSTPSLLPPRPASVTPGHNTVTQYVNPSGPSSRPTPSSRAHEAPRGLPPRSASSIPSSDASSNTSSVLQPRSRAPLVSAVASVKASMSRPPRPTASSRGAPQRVSGAFLHTSSPLPPRPVSVTESVNNTAAHVNPHKPPLRPTPASRESPRHLPPHPGSAGPTHLNTAPRRVNPRSGRSGRVVTRHANTSPASTQRIGPTPTTSSRLAAPATTAAGSDGGDSHKEFTFKCLFPGLGSKG